MSSPVILILGAGPKIGQSVAGAFAAKGYKVAVAARSIENGIGDNGYLGIKLDLSVPANVESAFTTVTEKLGIPSVVVYNGKYS
jgi:NAD(P)-dependent dehydrogenase (short-subunit alcohol dehydrogenase family)